MEKLNSLFLIAILFLYSCNCIHLTSKTKSLSESSALTLAKKYMPYVYFHSNEGYFPTPIEAFKINWSKATLNDKNAIIDTSSYKGYTSLDQNAPIYVSVLENSDGTIRISYLFLYAWNDKGPKLDIYAKLVGFGLDKDKTVGDYGLGVHYSDVEHIEVYLNSNQSFNYAYYAYHSWGTDKGDEKYSNDITWDGTHPIVYAAKGSHASYSTTGDHMYKRFWYEKGTGYKTYCGLTDITDKGKKWVSTNLRLLKLNGEPTQGISNDENYLAFKYSGRLGVTYDNDKWDDLLDDIGYTAARKAVKVFSKSAANKMSDGINEVKETLEAECEASNSFYGRGFW